MSKFCCDYLGKDIKDIQDEDKAECPGYCCVLCDWCVKEE
jgi:hypothetical protein